MLSTGIGAPNFFVLATFYSLLVFCSPAISDGVVCARARFSAWKLFMHVVHRRDDIVFSPNSFFRFLTCWRSHASLSGLDISWRHKRKAHVSPARQTFWSVKRVSCSVARLSLVLVVFRAYSSRGLSFFQMVKTMTWRRKTNFSGLCGCSYSCTPVSFISDSSFRHIMHVKRQPSGKGHFWCPTADGAQLEELSQSNNIINSCVCRLLALARKAVLNLKTASGHF